MTDNNTDPMATLAGAVQKLAAFVKETFGKHDSRLTELEKNLGEQKSRVDGLYQRSASSDTGGSGGGGQ